MNLPSLFIETTESVADKNMPIIRDYLTKQFPAGIGKVLFIIPPDADENTFNFQTAKRGRYWNFPPYGAGVLATLFCEIETNGMEKRDCKILNLNQNMLEAVTNNAGTNGFSYNEVIKNSLENINFSPDLICFSVMFSQTHESLKHVLAELKTHTILNKAPIAIGGVHITNAFVNISTREKLLQDLSGVKFLFTYECEQSFKDFVCVVEGDQICNLSQVYIADLDQYQSNKSVPNSKLLDVIPKYEIMEISKLSKFGKIGSFYCHTTPDTKIATIVSNRGCRAQCTFCSVRNFNGVGVRHRSIESIIKELKILRYGYDIKHIMWLDDDIFKDSKRTVDMFNAIANENLGMTFDCSNGVIAASCTDEILSASARAGLIGLNIGMESGSKKILREIKKPGTPATFLEAAEKLKKYPEINSRVFLMIGFPGETYKDILDTFEVAREMSLDWYNITILQPLPNTPIFDSMVAQGYIDPSKVDFSSIRYNSGGLGKHQSNKNVNLKDVASVDFIKIFQEHNLNDVPEADELDKIWAFMNYHLNFKPLLFETREIKLKQKLEYIQNLCDIVVPENAFAQYFRISLLNKMGSGVGQKEIDNLREYVLGNTFWEKRFVELGLDFNILF